MPKATAPPTEWTPTGRALAQLGISRRSLHRWIGQGLLVDGEHYRRGLTRNSPMRWNVPAVQRRIEQLSKLPDPLRPDSTGDQALAAAADN